VAAPDGQRLADQRTVPAELSAAQQQSVPVGKRTALEIQKKVWPPERQYKANLPFTRLGRESARSEGGERVRYYLGVDWADQTHAVWGVDEGGTKIAARTVPHTAEGLREWAGSEEADGDSDHDPGQPHEQPTREYSCPEELAV